MTPGSRPILATHYVPGRPDFVAPALVDAVPAARARFEQAMRDTWSAIDRLLDLGVPPEQALYLLPNAFPIRFEESGDLLNLRHRWTQRLCYLAQEEIFEVSRDEVAQVACVHPTIARHLLAPCGLRKQAGVKPFCPEGARFCGCPVWDLAVPQYERLL
jgi:thymidylate synthase ThyX